MERERYGRGGGGGGINRYPDVSGRTQQAPPPREDRGRGRSDRPAQAPAARGSNEPWSDVPPELEALLRAQVAQKPAPGRPGQGPAPTSEPVIDRDGEAVEADVTVASGSKPRVTRKPAAAKATTAKAAAKPRTTRKPAAATAGVVGADESATAGAPTKPATKPRAARKPAAKADATIADDSSSDAAPATAPKRRTTRKVAAPAEPV
jgi:hypothetical protein